jgi:hypothetical protein
VDDEPNQYSPAGELQRMGALLDGLQHNPSGRRRAGLMLVGLAAAFAALYGIVALLAALGAIS